MYAGPNVALSLSAAFFGKWNKRSRQSTGIMGVFEDSLVWVYKHNIQLHKLSLAVLFCLSFGQSQCPDACNITVLVLDASLPPLILLLFSQRFCFWIRSLAAQMEVLLLTESISPAICSPYHVPNSTHWNFPTLANRLCELSATDHKSAPSHHRPQMGKR
jgi:hypothetical protein